MTPTTPPERELVALVSDDMVQAALDASDAYWSADARMEKCQACNGTGKVPCGESQDWCNCDGGTVNTGTEAGAMRAALDAYLATRAATLPQGVSVQDALDARRYRWLRATACEGRMETRGPHPDFALNCDEPEYEWDSAIDAARTPPPAELGKGDV